MRLDICALDCHTLLGIHRRGCLTCLSIRRQISLFETLPKATSHSPSNFHGEPRTTHHRLACPSEEHASVAVKCMPSLGPRSGLSRIKPAVPNGFELDLDKSLVASANPARVAHQNNQTTTRELKLVGGRVLGELIRIRFFRKMKDLNLRIENQYEICYSRCHDETW